MKNTAKHRSVQLVNRYLSSVSRYDLVLTLLPGTLLLSLTLAHLLGFSHRIAFLGWVLIGVLALVDSLFVHPPTAGRRSDEP